MLDWVQDVVMHVGSGHSGTGETPTLIVGRLREQLGSIRVRGSIGLAIAPMARPGALLVSGRPAKSTLFMTFSSQRQYVEATR